MQQDIDTAIGCMPTELIRIIGDYATEVPHTFSAIDGSIEVVCTDIYQTVIGVQKSGDFRWNRLISAQTFDIGHLQWTVDFGIDSDMIAWIGVGVTSRPATDVDLQAGSLCFEDMAGHQDWLLLPYEFGCIHSIHDRQLRPTPAAYDNQNPSEGMSNDYRFIFAADPVGCTVSCRVWQTDRNGDWRKLDDKPPITLLTADASTFASLRPIVVVGGYQQAVFRSGPMPVS